MTIFIAYLLVAVGVFIGSMTVDPGPLFQDILAALLWPVTVLLAMLIQLGIIKL